MVDLFEKIEEGVEFAEAANTPIPGGKVVNIAYLLILRTGGIKKPVNSGKTVNNTNYHFPKVMMPIIVVR